MTNNNDDNSFDKDAFVKEDLPSDGHASVQRANAFHFSLLNAEGGYEDILPKWASPTIQIRACVEHVLESGEVQLIELPHEINALNVGMATSILNQFGRLNMSRIHHYAQLGEFSTVLYKEKLLIDVLIHVENRTFYAHRNVLCCHSEFFAAILLDNSIPPNVITDFTLYSIKPALFKDFIHFIYFGEVDITEEKLQHLLTLCDKLQANIMRARIHMYMAVTGNVSLEFIKEGLLEEQSMNRRLAIKEAIKKFSSVLMEDLDLLTRLTADSLREILSADSLQVTSELDVFWAVIFWLAYDAENRLPDMNKLMETVRFTCMSTLEIIDCCKMSKLLRLSDACIHLIMHANWVCHARETGLQDPLNLNVQKARSCLEGLPPNEPTKGQFDRRYVQYKTLLGNVKVSNLSYKQTSLSGQIHFTDEVGSRLESVTYIPGVMTTAPDDASSNTPHAANAKDGNGVQTKTILKKTKKPTPHDDGNDEAEADATTSGVDDNANAEEAVLMEGCQTLKSNQCLEDSRWSEASSKVGDRGSIINNSADDFDVNNAAEDFDISRTVEEFDISRTAKDFDIISAAEDFKNNDQTLYSHPNPMDLWQGESTLEKDPLPKQPLLKPITQPIQGLDDHQNSSSSEDISLISEAQSRDPM